MSVTDTLASSGVSGLNHILRGGFPRNRLYLVMGDPGAGKTTLSLQFLLAGAQNGERGLYISLSETKSELVEVAASHGWSMDGISILDLSSVDHDVGAFTQNSVFHAAEVELGRTVDVLLEAVKNADPARVVFDSLSELRLLAQDPLRYRRQMLALKQFFVGRNCTVLLLDDRDNMGTDHQIDSIAHGVLSLQKLTPDYGTTRRRLEIVKLRGVSFRAGKHDFVIQSGGLKVFPRLIAAEHQVTFEQAPVATGVDGLDKLLGGGLDQGTSTLIMGPAGSGKSTLAIRSAVAVVDRGENAVIYSFDETLQTLRRRSAMLGMDLEEGNRPQLLTLRHLDPAELSPGEFADELRRRVIDENLRLVVIDSLNGYMKATPEESYLLLHLHELLTFLNQQGVVTILILAQQGLLGHMESPADLTYLADTVLVARYFEARGSIRKALSVFKKRSGEHERTIREFRFDRDGLKVGEPLLEFGGILTGTPTFTGSQSMIMN